MRATQPISSDMAGLEAPRSLPAALAADPREALLLPAPAQGSTDAECRSADSLNIHGLQPFLAVCDRLALPLCLFDERAAVVWCNECARALAKNHVRRRSQVGDFVLFADLQRRLKHQIGSVRSWPSDRIEAVVDGLGDTSLVLVRIIDGDTAFVIGLFIRKVANDRTARQRQLAKFGLTSTECWIAEQMLCGRTTFEITNASTITLHTVRTHIKHIYSKLGVHCREKMRAKLETG